MKLVAGGNAARRTDELYQLPLDQFTPARDALAASLKAAGDKDGAAAVKSLRKPSVPAWAANQVVWQARVEWERLGAAAEDLRTKQEQATSPDELRQAGRDQRDALHACEARAVEFLGAQGHAASPAVLQKVGHTLLALAYGASDGTPGRMDHELQPPGFEALAGLTLAAMPPPPVAAVVPSSSSPKTEQAPPPHATDESRVAAERKAENEERARRLAAIANAEGRLIEAKRTAEKARKRLAAEEEAVSALEQRLEAACDVAQKARAGVDAAEAEATAAQAALEDLQV